MLLIPAPGLAADDVLPGPIPAAYVKAYDGDTATVRARIWPGHVVTTDVRLARVDAAEIRADCPREKDLAEWARALTRRVLDDAEQIHLRRVRRGKYAGRVVARVSADGRDLGQALLDAGVARRYEGGARESWCPPDQQESARE